MSTGTVEFITLFTALEDFDTNETGLQSAYNPTRSLQLRLHIQMHDHKLLLLPTYSESVMLLGQSILFFQNSNRSIEIFISNNRSIGMPFF